MVSEFVALAFAKPAQRGIARPTNTGVRTRDQLPATTRHRRREACERTNTVMVEPPIFCIGRHTSQRREDERVTQPELDGALEAKVGPTAGVLSVLC